MAGPRRSPSCLEFATEASGLWVLPDHLSSGELSESAAEGLTSVLQAEKQPGCECDPGKEEDPDAAGEEVVLIENLRQRAMLERQTHEKLEGHRETQPDEPDEKGLVARCWGPDVHDQPDEKPHEQRADEGRELMSAKLRHILREDQLARVPGTGVNPWASAPA